MKYQMLRLAEGEKGFGIVNSEDEYYSKDHFDGTGINNFTWRKDEATLMSIAEAHKLAYQLNK